MSRIKWTLEKTKKAIQEIHGDTIKIDETTFVGFGKRCKFIDKDYGEWWTRPENIVRRKQGHKKRGLEKHKTTIMKKYGVENVFQIDTVKQKIKETNIEKYGVDHINKLPSRKNMLGDLVRKYSTKDVREWVGFYYKCWSMSEVSRKLNIPESIVSKYFKKYKKELRIKYIDDFQNELMKENKRLCLPLTGCGEIKKLDEFWFRKDTGKYQGQCKECRSKNTAKWKENNPERVKNYSVDREKVNKWAREKKKTDIQFRLIKNIRSRVSNALKGKVKRATAKEYLGCSVKELKLYLESKFYPHSSTGEQMTWENYGLHGWHIDHIKPLSKFKLIDRGQLLLACHYTNLQPLWAEENLSKGNKYDFYQTSF